MVPNLDGFVLPLTVRSALSTGQFNRVPVIEGSDRERATTAVLELVLSSADRLAGVRA